MANWKESLSRLFPEIRKKFCLRDKAAAGASNYWHKGVATGIILPIKGVNRHGHLLWQTPYQMTAGGRVDEYQIAGEGEIIVFPEPNRAIGESEVKEPLAYLIAIDPAPGLETAFERIDDKSLTGFLAHELAEVDLARQQPNYHYRITHHNLPEYEVDKMATDRGYGDQVHFYLQFLLDNVSNIRPREEPKSFLDNLAGLGVNIIGKTTIDIPQQAVVEACRTELETRLRFLEGKQTDTT